MDDVADIANMSARAAKWGAQKMHWMATPPDDGKPKTCWIKSHLRGFGKLPAGGIGGLFSKNKQCPAGKELSKGLCYDSCPQGHGNGPVCWGKCPAETTECGLLC